MSILTTMISYSGFLIHLFRPLATKRSERIRHSSFVIRHFTAFTLALPLFIVATGACKPKEDVQLRKIRDIVVDASSDPLLRANAILYNPNKVKMTVKKIDMEVYVDGKKAAIIDQQLRLRVPAQAEFTVPLEVKLNLKELGFMDTVFALLGGKRMEIHYKGSIRLSKAGVGFNVPVNYKDEIRVRL